MDNAVYVNGKHTANPASVEETCAVTREHGGTAWVDLAWPTQDEIQTVADEFSLHHLPELHRTLGYPLAIAGMIALGGIFYWIFKRVGWL